jgi:hypothetical protein
MATAFERLAARLDAAVDRAYGERVRIEPRGGGRISAGMADPSRPAREVTATVVLDPSEIGTFSGRRSGTSAVGGTSVETLGPIVQISPSEAAILGYTLAEGDYLVLIDRPDQPRRRILKPPQADERGLITLDIGPVAA